MFSYGLSRSQHDLDISQNSQRCLQAPQAAGLVRVGDRQALRALARLQRPPSARPCARQTPSPYEALSILQPPTFGPKQTAPLRQLGTSMRTCKFSQAARAAQSASMLSRNLRFTVRDWGVSLEAM
jgi:hypothetical protein